MPKIPRQGSFVANVARNWFWFALNADLKTFLETNFVVNEAMI
jgi:hypothetical protein